jgi:hypothetical protein
MIRFMEPSSSSEQTIVGKYRLEETIGEGGMATVWRARHVELGRLVAVKFLHLAGPREKVRDRFLREARVAAAVDHRNVVDIIDFGTDERGDPYMVMEYLNGETLQERLASDNPISFDDVIRIFARTLSGLAAVHAAKITATSSLRTSSSSPTPTGSSPSSSTSVCPRPTTPTSFSPCSRAGRTRSPGRPDTCPPNRPAACTTSTT